MKPLQPAIKLSLMQKILKKLGVSSVSEEIQKAARAISFEDYPLESELCRDLTLKLLISPKYNKSCLHSMHNPDNGNSYFHKEYDTKGYKKFLTRYEACRFIIEDLIEKVYYNSNKDSVEVSYNLGKITGRVYTLDVSALRDACERSIKGCPSVPRDRFEAVVRDQIVEFISQYAQLFIEDLREFGFDTIKSAGR